MTNYAFIDSQNLNLGVRADGWSIDFKRFRVYLHEKYRVNKAYMFLGYIPQNIGLYRVLQEAGFECIFKPALIYKDGVIKGNCDAELVLRAMIDFSRYKKAVIVTGDGDFYCLLKYLIQESKLEALLIPNKNRFSALYKRADIKRYLRYMNDLRQKLQYIKIEKAP